MLSKLSILCFYHRIFSIDNTVKRFMKAVGLVVIANCVAAMGGLIFANSPVEGQWNLSITSTTINNKAFWVTIGIVNLVLDMVVLAIPQSRVWKLQLSRQRKLGVSFVFLLGGFVCIATTIRVIYMARIDVSDITYQFTIPGIWTCVEMNGSIICACLPAVYSLFKVKTRRDSRSESKSQASVAHAPGSPESERNKYLNLDTTPQAHERYYVQGAGLQRGKL
ncbi:hypothetical protein JDV02_005592 [Purpureocillium takamizusanense]|uniref:Rhodopsin domain-containing protein n=1 Tax=Purpureocillium takamizusanense TaxID=2060973 RepID=A0A9Q8QGT1_9HYPO|nr:uncharacterized protein JDV02_005592 [Purpureocillium takamizusanense]UNI19408.1 hypothetical protein JDV02_005592 [Purpureocillium takamizusanense]